MPRVGFVKLIPRGLAVAVCIAFGCLVSLGVWQLQRLSWKQGLIADIARADAMPPMAVEDALKLAEPAWHQVTLPECHVGLGDALYMHSEMNGQPGYRVLAACPTGAGASLLVDFGFAAEKTTGPVLDFAPVGRLRPFEKAGIVTPPNSVSSNDWYWRSAGDMGQALDAKLRGDYFIVLDLQAAKIAPQGLVQGPLTAPLPNRHLEYALTWFALAGVLLAMFAAFIVQKARKADTA